MNDIGAAIILTQPFVGCADVEEEQAARSPGVGGLQQGVGGKIGQHDRDAAIGQRGDGGGRVVAILELDVLEREALVQELAGRVVVSDRRLRTRRARCSRAGRRTSEIAVRGLAVRR